MREFKNKKIYSISEVNYFARSTLEDIELWVEGEITSFKKNPNWRFFYLDLKDENATLPCIADGSVFNEYGQNNITGQKILAYGFLTLYEPRGQYQLKITKVEGIGEGALQKKLEELIKKLKAEGLFDKKNKKEIPEYPKKVCVVTSEGSDAWNDFKRHTVDKFPTIELYTADVRVQGERSIEQLISILPKIDNKNFDVIVITRGGGSLEDLAAFNNEQIARSIFKMDTPTVVAIGHESNESLSEWVADVRASTPTDAANLITLGYQTLLTTLDNLKSQLRSKATYYFTTNLQKLDYIYLELQHTEVSFKNLPNRLKTLSEVLKRHEGSLMLNARQSLSDLKKQLNHEFKMFIGQKEEQLKLCKRSLFLLSPKNTLKRGYSITTNNEGQIVKSIKRIVVGQSIGVKLTDGSFVSKVTRKANQLK